ncbi:hypothetical protein C1X36_33795, partial [Pseudomonas sp. GW460-8]
MPGNRDVECQTDIASRLAPTRGVESSAKAAVSPIKLWECACSRKRSARQQRCQISDRHREQARSLKGSGVERKGCGITNQTVGVRLLGKAECQATEMLNVRPSSRAGSLPQGEWSR